MQKTRYAAVLGLLATALSQGTVRGQEPRAQVPADTYLNEAARAMVRDARARRATFDHSIVDYRTVSTERMSVGYRIAGHDKLLWRRETASRIHWARTGPIDIEVIGAREVVPVAAAKAQVPDDLKSFMPHIAFDPSDDELLLRFDTTGIIHPLSSIGERNYRFRAGDSSAIRLPDGTSVRLRELEFIPRRRDPDLIAGSFWLDMDTHAIVKAVFRLARQFEFNTDAAKEDRPPGWVPAMSMDLSYLAVDYGFYDLHWWLPRYVAAEGVAHLGPFGTVPMKYERTYTDYDVTGDVTAPRITEDSSSIRACTPEMNVNVSVHTDGPIKVERQEDSVLVRKQAQRDSARAARRAKRAGVDTTTTKKTARTCVKREYRVTQAPDSALLRSPELPGSLYAGNDLLSQSEIFDMEKRINDLPNVPWLVSRPHLAIGLGGPGLVRYNRIEGLSVGARAQVDLGRAAALGEIRFGTADKALSAELALLREATARSYRLGAYHRLVTTDPLLKPFSLPSSLGAFIFGVDDAKYFRTTGAELVVSPAAARTQWYTMRLYHERQEDVDRNTNFSVRHLLDGDYHFADNILASDATQTGMDVTLRHDFGLNPDKLRVSADIGAKAETGSFDFVRPTATLRVSAPVLFGLVAGAEAAAGTSTGPVPAQSNWYLGGTSTLRGYPIGALAGDAFWRGRGELATSTPIARISVFSDVGWAGPRADFSTGHALMSVGAGFSVMDGIVRFDIAHALRGVHDTRVYLYMGGIL